MRGMSRSIRWIAVAVVLTLSSASAAQAWPAAAPVHSLVTVEAGKLAATAWEWLASRLRPVEPRGRQTVKPKAGCGMDPDGKPVFCS